MKKFQIVSLTLAAALLLAGCGASESAAASGSSSEAVSTVETAPAESESESEAPAAEAALPDDIYTADFNTDSSMFHVNEACNGKGTLTVENGEMTMHVSLQSQKIVNLYLGMAADAPDHEDEWLQPTIDTVTYSDGTSDEVYGFDIPSSWLSWAPRVPGTTMLSACPTPCPLSMAAMPLRRKSLPTAPTPALSRWRAAAAALLWTAPLP